MSFLQNNSFQGYKVSTVEKPEVEITPSNVAMALRHERVEPACRDSDGPVAACSRTRKRIEDEISSLSPCDQMKRKIANRADTCPSCAIGGSVHRPAPQPKPVKKSWGQSMKEYFQKMGKPMYFSQMKGYPKKQVKATPASPRMSAPAKGCRKLNPGTKNPNSRQVDAQDLFPRPATIGGLQFADPKDRLCSVDCPRVYNTYNNKIMAPAPGPNTVTKDSSYGKYLYHNRIEDSIYAFPPPEDHYPQGAVEAWNMELSQTDGSFEDDHFSIINTSHDDSAVKGEFGYYDACCTTPVTEL